MSDQDSIKGFSIEQVEGALAALGAKPEPSAADRPLIAAGQLLALCEFIAATNTQQDGGIPVSMHRRYGAKRPALPLLQRM